MIDIQERLFLKISQNQEMLKHILILYRGLQEFRIPTLTTEQYPQGLGKTIEEIANVTKIPSFEKTSFSCVGDHAIQKKIESMGKTHWILAGIETHICLLQTAKDLILLGYTVIVPQETTSSRKESTYARGLKELEAMGARVTSVETLLFEMVKNSQVKEFKPISALLK